MTLRRRRLPALVLVIIVVAAVVTGCGAGTHPRLIRTPPPGPHSPPRGSWLGLAFNSSSGSGGRAAFSAQGVNYDRSGLLETRAGDTVQSSPTLASGVRRSLAAGMIPDVVVDPRQAPRGCTADPNASTLCLPTSAADVAAYVRGFVRTALSALRGHPGVRIVFEPMNEPWSWGAPHARSGRSAAAAYAAVLAPLLRSARSAGVPLADIYVPATGALQDGSSWIPDLYAARPCLAPGAGACGPVEGWNLHPYGRPGRSDEGIGMVPGERAQMRSGQDNLLISEIGFCDLQINGGRGCDENLRDIVGTDAQTARWLAQTLRQALAMRRAGWLKGLMIWDRAGDGWAMETTAGHLSAQGAVLMAFARRWVGPER